MILLLKTLSAWLTLVKGHIFVSLYAQMHQIVPRNHSFDQTQTPRNSHEEKMDSRLRVLRYVSYNSLYISQEIWSLPECQAFPESVPQKRVEGQTYALGL